jgi:hypothetical protein
MRDELVLDAQTLHRRVGELVQRQERLRYAAIGEESACRPSLGLILDELRQLEQEFEHVEYKPREKVLTVRTDPIELEELALGPFAIELCLGSGWHGCDSCSVRCIALKPNPAAGNDSITHPHVSNERLCAGDATVPIATALRQGRVCDAFCLVLAVLQEYNPQSPYVAIEDWDGERCEECNDVVDSDDLSTCDGCDRQICSSCFSSCGVCERSRCVSCLERDKVSRRHCCENCRHTCASCNRTVDDENFVSESDLCPECHAQREEEAEESDPESTPNDEEIAHEPDTIGAGDPDDAGADAADPDVQDRPAAVADAADQTPAKPSPLAAA